MLLQRRWRRLCAGEEQRGWGREKCASPLVEPFVERRRCHSAFAPRPQGTGRESVLPAPVGRRAGDQFGEARHFGFQQKIRARRVNREADAVRFDGDAPLRRKAIVARARQAEVPKVNGVLVGYKGQAVGKAYAGKATGDRLVQVIGTAEFEKTRGSVNTDA